MLINIVDVNKCGRWYMVGENNYGERYMMEINKYGGY